MTKASIESNTDLSLFSKIIDLSGVDISTEIALTRSIYSKLHGEKAGSGIYSHYDWARISYVFSLLGGGRRVLDVGVGSGQMINTLSSDPRFDEAIGVDITRHSKFVRLSERFQMKYMSVANLEFPDASFDAVICMEVLEHVDQATFESGLRELRRVCGGHLIMSVPFEEPEPLPSYHKQRFDRNDLTRIWPSAQRSMLKRRGISWALMEERTPTESIENSGKLPA